MTAKQPKIEVFTLNAISRELVYEHLLALCNNSDHFGIAKYENPTSDDFHRITIIDAKAITEESKRMGRGDVIGTIRLLPLHLGTVIQFVYKDASWGDPTVNPNLWQQFILTVKGYFREMLNIQIEYVEEPGHPRKGGRPSFVEDKWAWHEVNIEKRPKNEVFIEWLQKINVNPVRSNMVDPKRQFNRIIKPSWGNKPRQNI